MRRKANLDISTYACERRRRREYIVHAHTVALCDFAIMPVIYGNVDLHDQPVADEVDGSSNGALDLVVT